MPVKTCNHMESDKMTKKLLDQRDDKKSWEVNSDSNIGSTNIACIGKTKPYKKGKCKQEQARPFLYDRPECDRKFPLPRPILSNGMIPSPLKIKTNTM